MSTHTVTRDRDYTITAVDMEIFVLGNFRMINFRVENFS